MTMTMTDAKPTAQGPVQLQPYQTTIQRHALLRKHNQSEVDSRQTSFSHDLARIIMPPQLLGLLTSKPESQWRLLAGG